MHEENDETNEPEGSKTPVERKEDSFEEESHSSQESSSEQQSEAGDENKEEVEGSDEEPIDEDVIAQAVARRNTEKNRILRDCGVLLVATAALAIMIYLLLTLLGLSMPSRPLVVSKGAAKPFFHGVHRKLIQDNYDGTIRLSGNQTMSVILLYSPYSIRSKWFREEYYTTARRLKKLHGNLAPYFGATNCFDQNSYCRRKYNLKQYPAMMAQNSALMGSVYNGPLDSVYVTRWLNRLQNGVFRLQSAQDLTTLSKNHDLLTILYFKIKTPPQKFQSASNFSKLAYHYLDGDPNTDRTIFCIVTDSQLAAQLQLHNEHDLVLVSSELKLLTTHYKGWVMENVHKDLVKFSQEAAMKNVEFLNLGRRFHSTQLAEKFNQGSVLMYFTRDLNYGNAKYKMFREIAQEYRTCPEKDFISVDSETPDNFDLDCSTSLKGILCEANNTLSFMMIDSKIENALAAKYGADWEDMVVAINSKQEITRYIKSNITRESINCLIRQHHNSADNSFVTESTEIITTKTETPKDIHADAVGESSFVKFVDSTAELLLSRKINVILFMGGIWHSASSSAIAPFHLVANHFKESKNLIDFSIVDVSETKLPYNLNFDQLPKILITSADSIGLSWTYPEEFMINHTNIARFVLTRPGKIFGRLRWMDSCQGTCRKRAQREMRDDRLQLKRRLGRNVANSVRQRVLLGYYDRMLRMIS